MEELMRIVDPRDPLDLYERHTMIDSGSTCTVDTAHDCLTGDVVAIKKIVLFGLRTDFFLNEEFFLLALAYVVNKFTWPTFTN